MVKRVGVREFIKNSTLMDKYDYIEIEDKKSNRLKGIFISYKLAKDFEEFLKKRKGEEVKKKLEAFEEIVKSSKASNKFLEQFEKDDPKILQKVKGMME